MVGCRDARPGTAPERRAVLPLPALLALLLGIAAGCGDILELQYDPLGDRRPSLLVRRVREEAEALKDTYRQERRGGYGPVDFQVDEIIAGARAMEQDLTARGARFGEHLARARQARWRVDPLMQDRARVSPRVREQWRTLRRVLDELAGEFDRHGTQGIYDREAAPRER